MPLLVEAGVSLAFPAQGAKKSIKTLAKPRSVKVMCERDEPERQVDPDDLLFVTNGGGRIHPTSPFRVRTIGF